MAGQPQLDAFFKIAGMLETVIFNGSTGGMSREFYTMPSPGIFIDPKLTQEANSKDMELISTLFDGCFESTLFYNPTLTTVSQTYNDILNNTALPDKVLTGDQIKRRDQLEREIELMFDSYHKYKERYDYVRGEIIREQGNNEPADILAKLNSKLQFSLSEWKLRGKKDKFEEAQAEVAYFRLASPKLHFENLRNRFAAHTQTTGTSDYQATYLSPPIHEWNSPYAGWAQFNKTFKYSELETYSKHTSWSGSAGASFGLFKIGGSASGSTEDEYLASEDTDIELSFEYLRVRVLRRWLVSDVFRYHYWTYRKDFGYKQVSDGYVPGTTTPIGPTGLMPVLPTDIVIARNVKISASFNQTEREFTKRMLNTSVGGGWGPFRAKGSYKTTTTDEIVQGTFDNTTLNIANPQIIAMMGILLPKTPDPDRRLDWGKDAAFEDDSSEAIAGILSVSEYDKRALEQHEILSKIRVP